MKDCRQVLKQVLKVLRDARLHLERTPPSIILDVLHYGHHWGVIPVVASTAPLLFVTARPATKAPVTTLYLRGRRCMAEPNALNSPTPHVSQPLTVLHSYAPAGHFTDCDVAWLSEPVPRSVRQV